VAASPSQKRSVLLDTPECCKYARDVADAVEAVRQLANDGGLRHAAGVEEWEIRIEAHPAAWSISTMIRAAR
jgi:uncharacterized membrane-anchored protein